MKKFYGRSFLTTGEIFMQKYMILQTIKQTEHIFYVEKVFGQKTHGPKSQLQLLRLISLQMQVELLK